MKKTIKKRTVLKKWVRISLLAFILVIFLSGIGVLFRGYEFKSSNTDEVIYNYHIAQSLDYKVNLNKNSFIEDDYLGKGETYITDLVKNMDLNLSYYFSGTTEIPLTYTYEILANIKGEYTIQTGEEKSKVWTKESTLLEKKEVKTKSNQIVIKENIPLDFNSYNQTVQQFRKELKLPITAALNVIVKIKVAGELEENFQDEQTLTLQIPLNEQAFKIEEDYEEEIDRTIYKKTVYQGEIKNKNLISGIILIILSITLTVVFFREIFNVRRKNNYSIQLNKILKSYGDVIIEIKTPINLEPYNIIDVKDFNEMIDLEEELRIPINFYETIDSYEGEFFIIHNDMAYRYVLTNETEK